MLKVITLSLVFLSVIIGCGSSHNQLSIPAQCADIPPGAVLTAYGCPGARGTWTRYTISYNNSTTSSSGDFYCGGDGSGVPASQSAFNVVAISDPKVTSNNDYVKKNDCSSGSVKELTPSGEITYLLIWKKQP